MPTPTRYEILQSFRPLWRVEDEQWLAQRQADWQHIRASIKKAAPASLKLLESYFVYGEKKGYLPGTTLLLFTPYDSAESVQEVFLKVLRNMGAL
ncbi:hypothetical protein GCM10011297_29010 [Bacterioplanes sanyensis]|uniref:hypothetical protein n=1 Tax=Bacterioplanes sanyensis TaxID=1249553 RepID=UPI0016797C17|nr:hypothetical protein [Bacterioplanes sanyensis]GGY54315.1 hypothetical protein GCM10011297_29010 [Bacterioplanes sanyensis]